jgi:hypothetical protein
MTRLALLFVLLLMVACGSDDDGASADASTTADSAPSQCPRMLGAADRTRYVVIAHPFDASSNPSGAYEVLELDTAGTFSRPGTTFEMQRANGGRIAFTPDGEIGIVAQDDGTLGVFRLDATGSPTVIHAAFDGPFYADSVMMSDEGDRAFVFDNQWRNNGGGVYSVRIECDGTLTSEGLVFAAKLPAGMARIGDANRFVLAADDAIDSPADQDAHIVDLAGAPAVVDSASSFGDPDAILSSVAVTQDGLYAVIGDNASFSVAPNQLGVLAIMGDSLIPSNIITPVEDPVSMVASPDNDTILVISGFGNAAFVLDYNPMASATNITLRGEMTYIGASPQLPDQAILIERGALRGRVLISENVGVHQVSFDGGGVVTDRGVFTVGPGVENIVGAMGVQP